MSYYVQSTSNGLDPNQVLGLWEVDETIARRIDVLDSDLGRFLAHPGITALETLRRSYPGATFDELELGPGDYPGMARPVLWESLGRNPDQSVEAMSRRASASGQLHALIQQLEQICRVVHPKESNFRTYGHEIRNVLLILACMELESQWKAILATHRTKAENTTHYVKLSPAMKLAEYAVEFPYYPWMPERRPFEGWQHGTKDLPWYGAYNSVKHNHDDHFPRASLDNAFDALTGFFVMLCAQYGSDFALEGDAASRAFFRLKASPQRSLKECYVPAYVGTLRERIHISGVTGSPLARSP